jgi:DNA polymerase-1
MRYRYITEHSELSTALNRLEKGEFLFLDTETTPDRVRLIQLGNDEEIYVIDLFEIPQSVEKIKELLGKKGVVGHNLKFDLKVLNKLGIYPASTFDTFIASHILGFERHSLRHLAEVLLGKNIDKSLQLSDWSRLHLTKEQIEYAAVDVFIVKNLFYKMRENLNRLPETDRGNELLKTRTARIFNLNNPAVIIEMAFVQEVAKIESSGLPVDENEIENLIRQFEKKLQRKNIDFFTKYRIDPMSPKQIGTFLKNRLGLDLPETQKGNISTDDKTLAVFSNHREVREILEIRKTKKMLDKLKEISLNIKRGRIYPEFKQIGAVTGRMASSNPNVQNIPREMRSLFRAEKGKVFIIADFSQIELRIAAEYVKDQNMIKAFREGKDMHRYTASLVLSKEEDEVTKQERQIAKALNFGLIYGISARGLSEYARASYGVDLDPDSASRFRKRFFEFFKSFKEWHENVKKILKENDEVKGSTLLGRPYKAFTFTDAVNYPIQGTGADILKLSVLLFDVNLKKLSLKADVVNLVHDEILVECDKSIAKEIREILKKSMIKAGSIALKSVPIEIEAEISEKWEKS